MVWGGVYPVRGARLVFVGGARFLQARLAVACSYAYWLF